MPKSEKWDNSDKYLQNFTKNVNQVICVMYQSRKPDIKRLSIYFVDNIALLYKMPKFEKANKDRILQKYVQNFTKS